MAASSRGSRGAVLAAAVFQTGNVWSAAAVPECAWIVGRKDCEPFEFGDRFLIGRFGEKTCPAGYKKIHDIATCKEAQSNAGFMYESAGQVEGTGICHWCGGCTPNKFRLLPDFGMKAKPVCVKEGAAPAAPARQASAVQPSAAKEAGLPWPECQEKDTVIRGAGQALFANLQGYGATVGCFLDDCMSSDKFIASEIESCTKVCHSLPECAYWVWGVEEGEQKCWFRTGDKGREGGEGWVSGKKACAPPGTTVLPMGNTDCWAEGFGYGDCCDAKYGPNGNAQCWDGVYNYDRCCFPKDEL